MEYVTSTWAWVVENWDLVVEIAAGLYAVASLVVALTPTPDDDEWLDKVKRFVVRLSFLSPRDVGGTFSMPGAMPDPNEDQREPEDE